MVKKILLISALLPALLINAEELISSVFTKNAANWYALKNFGTAKADPASGTLNLSVNPKGELRLGNWKQITAAMCAGKTLKITAVAKGKGELNGVFVLSVKSASGGRSYPRLAGKPVTLGDEFVTVEHTADLSKYIPLGVEPRLELKGAGAYAQVKSIKFEVFTVEDAVLRPECSYIAYPAGKTSDPLQVNITANADAELNLISSSASQSVKADGSGKASVELPPSQTPGITAYTLAGKGVSAKLFTEAVAPEEFDALTSAAGKSSLAAPAHVLVLGDSLSDFDRGRNYVDQLDFYFKNQKKSPINFYNFGIGGDDIKRVTRRLTHHFNPKTSDEYFQKRYADISKVKYSHIIVFLGQNDTKASSKSGYSTTFVPTEKWQSHYDNLLSLLKKQFPNAKIILCSPIHVNSARQDVIAQAILKRKDNVWKFGIEKHMENYASMVQQTAKKYGAQYIDLYTPSKNHPQLKDLFVSDGVHLSPAGERFVTLQLLQNL